MASGEAIKKDLGLSDLFSVYVFRSKHAPFVIVQEKNVAKKCSYLPDFFEPYLGKYSDLEAMKHIFV